MKTLEKYHVRQLDQSDCGVACLKAVLKYFGSDAPLERLREISGTSITGTTMLGILQAGKDLGLAVNGFEADLKSLKECTDICMLHVVIDKKLQHFLVYYGYDEQQEKYLIGDPSKTEVEVYSAAELEKIWTSKSLLLFKPTDALKAVNDKKLSKWKWLIDFVQEDINILSIALVIGVGVALLGLSTAIFSQKLVDDILPSGDAVRLFTGAGILFLLLIFKSVLGFIRQFFLLRQSKDFNVRIIDYFYSSLMHLPKSFFDNRKTGELIARMNDTSRIQRTITRIVGDSMINALMVIVATGAIFYYNWQIGLLAMGWIPVFGFIVFRFHPQIVKGQRSVMEAYAKNESNYVDTIQGIGMIKINNKQSMFSNITKHVYSWYQESIFSLGKIGIRYNLLTEIAATLFIVGVLVWSSVQVLNDNLTTGGVIAILQFISMLVGSAAGLAMANLSIQEAKIAFDRMNEYTSIDSELNVEEDLPKAKIQQFEELKVENLAFRFPGKKRLIENISFNLRRGETIALLGESGSGKSTFLQIIQKFYKQEAGNIKVNGIDFDLLSTLDWRNHLGIVPQEIKLFNGTLIDNILMGDQVNDPKALEKFFIDYGFDAYFKNFPGGYATILGENGINISSGQQQLVGLARALWRKPQLLLLDEPTAALDRDTEHFVVNLLKKVNKNMGIFILTHRISTAKYAQQIYILENGTIEQQGIHLELLQTDNLYSRAWNDLMAA